MKSALNIQFLFWMLSVSAQTFTRPELREWFLRCYDDKEVLDSMVSTLKELDDMSPAEESYCGICHALLIQYEEGNWGKLRLVMKSRSYLNDAVGHDPRDPELRFMRLMLEHHLPSFLGLNKHIEDDLRVIFANPKFVDDNLPMKEKAIEFLLWTKRCTPSQASLLERELATVRKLLAANQQ